MQKMRQEIITISDNEIEKSIFLKKDVNIDNILISKKISYGKKNYKYCTGYMIVWN